MPSAVTVYLVVVAVIFGVNLLPAFGPPTRALLVFSSQQPCVTRASGRSSARSLRPAADCCWQWRSAVCVVASARHAAATSRRPARSCNATARGLLPGWACSPCHPFPPRNCSRQPASSGVSLLPLTAAFFTGRLVSYSACMAGASAAKNTSAGALIVSSLTSPWGIALQALLLVGVIGLTRIDWLGTCNNNVGTCRSATERRCGRSLRRGGLSALHPRAANA